MPVLSRHLGAKYHRLMLSGLFAAACSGDSLDPNRTPVDTVVVQPANATVTIGASVTLQAEARDVDGNVIDRQAFWAAADTDIASVTGDGMVTAKRMGQVQIAASIGGKSGMSSITVARTPVASVRLLPGNASLPVGGTVQLTADALDGAGALLTGRVVSWTSSNPAVASVTVSGLVSALASGASIISAVCEGKTGLTSINVATTQPSPGPAPSTLRDTIVITPASITIALGQSVQLNAVFYDHSGRTVSKDFNWSTSNSHTATVSSKGKVTGRGPGTATISATASGLRGRSTITVR